MGLFNRLRRKSDKAEKPERKQEAASKETAVVRADALKPRTASGAGSAILLTPHVSEKAAALSSKDTYVFDVPVTANKVEVRKAVEGLYGVKVESVRMIRGIGKIISRGKISGSRNRWKKALVGVKKGQKIDLHEGV